MGYIARRDGNTITLPCVSGGPLTIIHEAPNGFMVVKWPSRKPLGIPVRYVVVRLLTGADAEKARFCTNGSGDDYAEAPDVYVPLTTSIDAGSNWRDHRDAMIELAEERGARA